MVDPIAALGGKTDQAAGGVTGRRHPNVPLRSWFSIRLSFSAPNPGRTVRQRAALLSGSHKKPV